MASISSAWRKDGTCFNKYDTFCPCWLKQLGFCLSNSIHFSRKHVLSDTWNTAFLKMHATSIADTSGQPIYQFSMSILAHGVQANFFQFALSFGVTPNLLWCFFTLDFHFKRTYRCLGLNCCLILQIDSHSQMLSRVLNWKVSHFLPNASLDRWFLQTVHRLHRYSAWDENSLFAWHSTGFYTVILLGRRLDVTLSFMLCVVWPIKVSELSFAIFAFWHNVIAWHVEFKDGLLFILRSLFVRNPVGNVAQHHNM